MDNNSPIVGIVQIIKGVSSCLLSTKQFWCPEDAQKYCDEYNKTNVPSVTFYGTTYTYATPIKNYTLAHDPHGNLYIK